MDASQYSSRNGGLALHELLQCLEEDDDNVPMDIYVQPPDDGKESGADSDLSDDEHEANLDHLPRNLLSAPCEVRKRLSEDMDEDEYSSEDDLSLSELRKKLLQDVTHTKSKKTKSKVTWQKTLPTNCIKNAFLSEVSMSQEVEDCKTPVDFFRLFFNDSLIELFVTETNRYALQKNKTLNVTKDEMFVFIGGMLLSGYAKYPNKRMYWSQRIDVPRILSDAIRLHRFENILTNFHLNDNDAIDKNDRLYKLRPLLNHLNESFKTHGSLEENLSIDESMIPYYGKHYAKQYIKGKPIRFGFKNWALCASSGYMISFDVYTGKGTVNEYDFGLGGDVVIRLIKQAELPPSQGHKLFFDNYFTSVQLMLHLTQEGFCATGTIRESRTEKALLKDKKIMQKSKRGHYDFCTNDDKNILLIRWKDNQVVTLATNFDSARETTCTRWNKTKKAKESIVQPQAISSYNKSMGGVDLMDQMVAVYRTRMRQRKWWWPIFSYFLDVTVVNSWILMKKIFPNNEHSVNLLNFRRYLANCFLQNYGKPSSRGKIAPTPLEDVRYDGKDHWPEYCVTDRRCRVCGKKSNFLCLKCNIGLHPKTCFKVYHVR
ncbi:piggyBac transposable element-derived protein 2-like [Sitophilus oryzae]|uniref:PiggyBac transposable element-derived protein 2-like n=1 Tax=Sitophilus oryzae TaxID=7048 RepID=A0A6J2X893_SITOR|nr:piggyBac transposable element-derived protein 2-like [Sitophilus oryzae]